VADYKKTVKENGGELNPAHIAFAEHHDFQTIEPKEVMQLISDRAFTMAGDISDEVLKKVKQSMYNGVKSGASYKDMVYQIEDAIAPYLDLTDTSGDLSGARLMTAVRTNVSSAYNDARDSIFMDPELDGFVVAFMASAVIDSATTPGCRDMDGRIFKATNPIWDEWPFPAHFNCRTIKIPITKADDWDGIESDLPTEEPAGW
jgi:SPP1 gp7 family putative phage head morphogenesis protein